MGWGLIAAQWRKLVSRVGRVARLSDAVEGCPPPSAPSRRRLRGRGFDSFPGRATRSRPRVIGEDLQDLVEAAESIVMAFGEEDGWLPRSCSWSTTTWFASLRRTSASRGDESELIQPSTVVVRPKEAPEAPRGPAGSTDLHVKIDTFEFEVADNETLVAVLECWRVDFGSSVVDTISFRGHAEA